MYHLYRRTCGWILRYAYRTLWREYVDWGCSGPGCIYGNVWCGSNFQGIFVIIREKKIWIFTLGMEVIMELLFEIDLHDYELGDNVFSRPSARGVIFDDYIIVVEVTMSTNSRQEAMEGEPVRRHVADLVMTEKSRFMESLLLIKLILIRRKLLESVCGTIARMKGWR